MTILPCLRPDRQLFRFAHGAADRTLAFQPAYERVIDTLVPSLSEKSGRDATAAATV